MKNLFRNVGKSSKIPPSQFKNGLNDNNILTSTQSHKANIDKRSFETHNFAEPQRGFSAGRQNAQIVTWQNNEQRTTESKRVVHDKLTAPQTKLRSRGNVDFLNQNHMHLGILLTVVAMLCFGLVMIFSASMNIGMYANNNPYFYINRQYVATLLGLFIMFIIANINIKYFNKAVLAFAYYVGTMGLLIMVLIPRIGIFYNGQRRWLRIPFSGNTTFQPSEIAKVGVPFILAFYFSQVQSFRDKGYFNVSSAFWQRWVDGFIDIAFPTGIIGSWCLPISLQSHMSAVFIMLLLTFILLLAMRLPWRSWLYGGSELLAVLLCLILLVFMLKPLLGSSFTKRWDHLAKRFEIFRIQNQDEDKQPEKKVEVDTYHSDQAFIAIASGGLTGTGLGQGKQKLNYLPEGHNDYIFSNIVEELGFVGGCVVLGMYIVFFLIGCSVVTRTTSIFSRLISLGSLFLLTIQGVLSIAVNVGVVPPTGVSMPFFSFGGTSNVFFLSSVGLILSVSKFAVRPSLAKKQQIALAENEIKQKFKDQRIHF